MGEEAMEQTECHRSPRSECCGVGLVWYRPDAYRFVPMLDLDDPRQAGVPVGVQPDIRCGSCNRGEGEV